MCKVMPDAWFEFTSVVLRIMRYQKLSTGESPSIEHISFGIFNSDDAIAVFEKERPSYVVELLRELAGGPSYARITDRDLASACEKLSDPAVHQATRGLDVV